MSEAVHKEESCCHEEPVKNDPFRIGLLKEKWASYKPLIVILIFCILLSLANSSHGYESIMISFMGYFFVFLSLFKFFDLQGFVKGFVTYDLITKHFKPYGYAYPFIELALGLGYIMGVGLIWVNLFTVIVMTVSGAGVIKSILSGEKINCACLGTVLNVPLSTVSILENFGMGAMAAAQLLLLLY
jgi:hypothetical protein